MGLDDVDAGERVDAWLRTPESTPKQPRCLAGLALALPARLE
jgi:hypothetical protein